MEIDKIIASVGWSQSVLLIALVAIFIFRKEIAEKITKIKYNIPINSNQLIQYSHCKCN